MATEISVEDAVRATVVELSAACATDPNSTPGVRTLGMCLSALALAGIADRFHPGGLEAELVALCSRIGDDAKIAMQSLGMDMNSVAGVVGIVDRAKERRDLRAVGLEPTSHPSGPAGEVMILIDRIVDAPGGEPSAVLQQIHAAVGSRLAALAPKLPAQPFTCAECGSAAAEYAHQPVQTHEGHLLVTYWDSKSQVTLCRRCAIAALKEHAAAADAAELNSVP